MYYLRLAAQRIAPRRATKLPLLTAEYQLGLPAFAKHLFEMLAHVLPADTVLVLDNYRRSAPTPRCTVFWPKGSPPCHPACVSCT